MGFISEFKEFAMRGNVIDMAVGIVIGGAFGKIVSSLVGDIIMPLVGLVTGGTNFTDMFIWLGEGDAPASLALAKESGAPYIGYGALISVIIDFIIIALAIFVVIKMMNSAQKKFEKQKVEEPAKAPEPSAEEKLLMEIRDAIKAK
ncbi:MAG: large-conductance mechanosensitive channel [Phycisphaeraceae bacterium]|nr:MAG: large-conductance mechanosensitive channel [Phycisphaeraceae bacterium]